MKPRVSKFQVGKEGLTPGVIQALNLAFKNRKQVRVSILKSATRDKNEKIKMAEDIAKKLPFTCNYRIIGYTIILIKKFAKKPTPIKS